MYDLRSRIQDPFPLTFFGATMQPVPYRECYDTSSEESLLESLLEKDDLIHHYVWKAKGPNWTAKFELHGEGIYKRTWHCELKTSFDHEVFTAWEPSLLELEENLRGQVEYRHKAASERAKRYTNFFF